MEAKKSRDTIQSLKLGISILDVLSKEKRALTVNEIHEKTKITKSNLYKYLNTLLEADLIHRDEDSGVYYLGYKLLEYGLAYTENKNLISFITPYLYKLSKKTNNSVIFALPTTNGPIIVKMVKPNQILNIGAELGTLLPANSSAGKIFESFASEWIIDHWKDKENSVLTTKEIDFIRKHSIAFANEPLIPEISSVAFPITSYNKELIGIISLVGFTSSIPKNLKDPITKYLLRLQSEINSKFN